MQYESCFCFLTIHSFSHFSVLRCTCLLLSLKFVAIQFAVTNLCVLVAQFLFPGSYLY